ncbi:MAG: hypothetical protein JWO67_5861 [Streptosporangiaceae bacterium]|nr:hypothetical protein [Streptosporangiaceae bacterium]
MTVRTRQRQGDTLERLDHPDRRGPPRPACQVQSFRAGPSMGRTRPSGSMGRHPKVMTVGISREGHDGPGHDRRHPSSAPADRRELFRRPSPADYWTSRRWSIWNRRPVRRRRPWSSALPSKAMEATSPRLPPYPWPTQPDGHGRPPFLAWSWTPPAGASPSADLAVSTNSRRSGCAARPSSGSRRTGLATVAGWRRVGSLSNRAAHLPAAVHGSGRRPPGAGR